MTITVEMPPVSKCSVTQCAYNADRQCHARAITVGDGVHPGCDTFFNSRNHARNHGNSAGVGACKVTQCTHNDDFECIAESIEVGADGNDVHCRTFSAA